MSVLLLTAGLTPSLMAQVINGEKPKYSDLENIGKRKMQFNFTSLEKEAAIGRQASAQIEQDSIIVDDSEINGYVDRIAQNIAKNSDSQFPITMKVIQSDKVNSYALPGGSVYVTTGLIKALDNEAELAFVIGYSVGHVAARTATRNMAKANILQIAAVPQIIFTGGVAATAIQEAAQLGIPMGMAHLEQKSSAEADFLGLAYMYKTGYAPQAAVSFFTKVKALEASRPKEAFMFSTVPPAADRIKATGETIKNVLPPRADNLLNTPEFDAIKARVERLTK